MEMRPPASGLSASITRARLYIVIAAKAVRQRVAEGQQPWLRRALPERCCAQSKPGVARREGQH